MNQLFVCDRCDHVDVTDLAYPEGRKVTPKKPLKWICTKCQLGEWHDTFPYEPYRPGFDHVINRESGLGLED